MSVSLSNTWFWFIARFFSSLDRMVVHALPFLEGQDKICWSSGTQNKALKVMAFRDPQQDRMIFGLGMLFHESHRTMGVLRRLGKHGKEILLANDRGT